MLIIHKLKDISLELFQDLKNFADDITTNIDSIKDAFMDYYTSPIIKLICL